MFRARRIFHFPIALSLITLAACSSEKERCISNSLAKTKDYMMQIKQTETNIERGYALHQQSIPYTETYICYDKERQAIMCQDKRMHLLETPVTIDLANEGAKLSRLKAKPSLPLKLVTKHIKNDQCRLGFRGSCAG
jgi:hypothetical protein